MHVSCHFPFLPHAEWLHSILLFWLLTLFWCFVLEMLAQEALTCSWGLLVNFHMLVFNVPYLCHFFLG